MSACLIAFVTAMGVEFFRLHGEELTYCCDAR